MIYISVLSVRGQLVIVLFAVEKRGWQTNLSLLTGDREAGRVAGLCGAGGGLGRCEGKGLKGEWEGVATFLSTILDSGVRNLEHKKIFNMDWKVKHVMTHYLQP